MYLNTELEEMYFPLLKRSQSREKELEGSMRLEELEEGELKITVKQTAV